MHTESLTSVAWPSLLPPDWPIDIPTSTKLNPAKRLKEKIENLQTSAEDIKTYLKVGLSKDPPTVAKFDIALKELEKHADLTKDDHRMKLFTKAVSPLGTTRKSVEEVRVGLKEVKSTIHQNDRLISRSLLIPATMQKNDGSTINITYYEDERGIIGRGNATVYVGRDENGVQLAVKYPDKSDDDEEREELLKSVKREAKTWATLNHQNILPFLGFCEINDDQGKHIRTLLVSPLVLNGNLRDYVKFHPAAPRLPKLRQLLDGMAYLHDLGLTHGDIKASNALVSPEGTVMLCDFELTKPTSYRTETQSASKGAGTRYWQSPEILDGGSRSPAGDVYAFGVTMFEVLSGRRPYAGISPSQVLIKIANQTLKLIPNPIPTAPVGSGEDFTAAWTIADECLAFDSDMRPKSRCPDGHGRPEGPECRCLQGRL